MSSIAVSSNDFAPTAIDVPECVASKPVPNEQTIVEYKILRYKSFDADLSPAAIPSDYYLKAKREADSDDVVSTDKYLLVKIVQKHCVPLRHMHHILGESFKIMRYMSATEPCNRYIHRMLNMFNIGQSHIDLFYENLRGHQSIHQNVSTHSGCGTDVHSSYPQQLTLGNMLSQTVSWQSSHGLAHRNIRA